jgi:hypothetical protein
MRSPHAPSNLPEQEPGCRSTLPLRYSEPTPRSNDWQRNRALNLSRLAFLVHDAAFRPPREKAPTIAALRSSVSHPNDCFPLKKRVIAYLQRVRHG